MTDESLVSESFPMDEPAVDSAVVSVNRGEEQPVSSKSVPPVSDIRPILPEGGIDLRAAVEEFESNLIRQALEKTGGNKNRAAQLLRVNRTTLVEMVKRKRLTVA
jgi:DNA-binding NtrC family response regulator